MLIQLPKKKVDPGAQNLHDTEIGNEKDDVLIFKAYSLTLWSFSEYVHLNFLFQITFFLLHPLNYLVCMCVLLKMEPRALYI